MKPGPLFKRKELWVPTWRGWLLAMAVFLGVAIFSIQTIPHFLSPTAPVDARVLVIEGWLGEDALEFAQALQKTNRYDLILTAGGRLEKGFTEAIYGTYANLGATRLRGMGYTETNLVAVPSGHNPKDRTYHSALSVRDFLLKTPHRKVDLLSDGVHSRRSWLLYRKALGPEFKVGIYATPPVEFQIDRWWLKSSGVRNVISEGIAFLYARLFFSPAAYEAPPKVKAFQAPVSTQELPSAFPQPASSSKAQ